MKQQKQRNQITTTGSTTKRGRTKLKAKVPSHKVTPLPSIFRTGTDVTALRLRTSLSFVNTENNFASGIMALSPRVITTPQYLALGNIFPMLSGMSDQYTHFMITKLTVQLIPTTPMTAGGFVALNYEPDDTNISNPPTALSDVASSAHSDIAQVSEIAGIECNPSDYFNDWRLCTSTVGASTALTQCGVVQLYASNTGSTGIVAAIVQLELDIHFSGFRKT